MSGWGKPVAVAVTDKVIGGVVVPPTPGAVAFIGTVVEMVKVPVVVLLALEDDARVLVTVALWGTVVEAAMVVGRGPRLVLGMTVPVGRLLPRRNAMYSSGRPTG